MVVVNLLHLVNIFGSCRVGYCPVRPMGSGAGRALQDRRHGKQRARAREWEAGQNGVEEGGKCWEAGEFLEIF